MKKLIAIFLLVFLLPIVSWAAIDCDRTTLANAISAASDGDTITCNAGTWTYTTGISISNKGLIIEGAGVGVTTLKAGATSLVMFGVSLQAGDPTFEIRDITFDLDGQDNVSAGLITLSGGGLEAFWIHDCEFKNQYGTVIAYNMGGLRASGLISSNTFQMNTGAGDKSIRVFGDGSESSDAFQWDYDPGGPYYLFVEDNTFTYTRFEDFAKEPPTAGLGISVEVLARLVQDDPVAVGALERAMQKPDGNPTGKNQHTVTAGTVDNIHSSTIERPSGTSEAATVRRLRKDRPDLHAQYLANEISANAAAILAGFRPKTFTVRADKPDSIVATLRRQLDPETLAMVTKLLTEED